MIKTEEMISVGWCDNGMVNGDFADGLLSVSLLAPHLGFPIMRTIRVHGNQIGRQRQKLLDFWYNELKTDWLFWIDSDIVLTPEIWKTLCSVADKEKYPLLTGVYFIAKEKEGSLPVIMPCIFSDVDQGFVKHCHPLPSNEIIKVDSAGMGLVMMHRDIVTKLKEKHGQDSYLFEEIKLEKDQFIGEDISFFRKCKEANIDLYAHTGIIAKHIKHFPFDKDYYNLFWGIGFEEE
jgi:hypothetical protein